MSCEKNGNRAGSAAASNGIPSLQSKSAVVSIKAAGKFFPNVPADLKGRIAGYVNAFREYRKKNRAAWEASVERFMALEEVNEVLITKPKKATLDQLVQDYGRDVVLEAIADSKSSLRPDIYADHKMEYDYLSRAEKAIKRGHKGRRTTRENVVL